jgi:hypothetical protein
VADEGHERWPLCISSFTQVKDVVQGARWSAPRPPRPPRAKTAKRARGRGKGT